MEIRKTGGGDFPLHLKMLISGSPKSGKSSYLGTVPNIVIADTEWSANNLQSIAHLNVPYVAVRKMSDLNDLVITLRDPSMRKKAAASLGIEDIEAVAIDTLDTLQLLMKKERLAETRQKQFLRDDWAWMKEELMKIVQAFTSLPLHVIFTVHLKSKEIGGLGSDAHTVVLPSLEGSVAEVVSGMVGYSLLALRRQELDSRTGQQVIRYLLRTEGDETFDFLGNRAAGRLPEYIEPDFRILLDDAKAGHARAAKLHEESVQVEISTPTPALVPAVPAASGLPPTVNNQQHRGLPAQIPTGDNEPVNAAALAHTKKVYEALNLPFPEDTIRGLKMGAARMLVRYWAACQIDAKEGKIPDAKEEMMALLKSSGWLPDTIRIRDINGTIEEVLAFVDRDKVKAQKAYDLEVKKAKPRVRLLEQLTSWGAVFQETPENLVPVDEPNPPFKKVAVVASTEPTPNEQEQEHVDVAIEQLNAIVTDVQVDGEVAPCEECGAAVNDSDIAVLGKSRFGRWLCVSDYIKETKK
jgi:hypothetical protein